MNEFNLHSEMKKVSEPEISTKLYEVFYMLGCIQKNLDDCIQALISLQKIASAIQHSKNQM